MRERQEEKKDKKKRNRGGRKVEKTKEAKKQVEKERKEEKEKKEETSKSLYGNKKLRVYSDGVFDMFHIGHMKMLEQVRKRFPEAVLIVGVSSDRDTLENKGLAVMCMKERAESLKHCKWVDEVVEDAPWIITKDFLDEHKIDYVAHDSDPYPSKGSEDVYHFVKELGIFVPTQRTEGISTSDLITRILRSYDHFVRRNLRKGISGEELNLSAFTEKRIRISTTMEENFVKIREKFKDFSEIWDKVSVDIAKRFIMLFDKRF
ncbi:choline-phosphate cytidylyltransferase [Nematocida sp. LUAm3]|nr:choline-phosphate cytidylyltransferase [Nematocida sp. LUAm3]KAI5175736.1 choline-phosphate cytidylyltransferase [Nematocida sp. LUAm2]KAI5178642.1 choline-phosphate cytidylyltransferase [Nematocida sp. LUAm1]